MSPPDASALSTVAAFAEAIAAPNRAVPAAVRVARGDRASRFAVYRNNVWVARLDVLDALFPVTRRLVGDDFLHDLGRRFFTEAPPANPVVGEWAEPFTEWLAADATATEWPWLVDVARLEAARLAAHHAAEAVPIGPEALAGRTAEALAAARVRFHPSARLLASAYPIGSIWAAHQGEGEPEPLATDAGETVSVVRPGAEVFVTVLAPGETAFFASLANGATIGEAAEAALAVDPTFDLADRLIALLRLGAVIDLV